MFAFPDDLLMRTQQHGAKGNLFALDVSLPTEGSVGW